MTFFRNSAAWRQRRRAASAAPTLRRTFVDLGMSPLCETYPSAADLNRGEMLLSAAHVTSARSASWCNWKNTRAPEDIFSDYAYFSSFSDSWLKHCENYCEAMKARFGLDRRALWSKWPATTATCCSISSSETCRCLGIEPAANVAKVAVEKGVPTLVRFFGTQAGDRTWRRRPVRRPGSRQQRAGAGSGPERLRRRAQDPAEARRRPDAGVPAPAAADRAQRVRHDLPRALLVFLAAHHDQDHGSARAEGVRRGGTEIARRIAPRLRLPRRERDTSVEPNVRKVLADEEKAGLDRSKVTRASRGR